ncbi:RNA methyltransferase [Cucumibacter marinus]|uniref:RNA methyltransferase n=1 Tax=Cucumibacter marinus TaxID=1121252 RepID=UPI00048D6F81|nr:RNA methyltransferase [Cucumibacter marinus]
MAGTDKSQALTPQPGPIIILCEPQLGENIGMVARAMANFGLWDLRLVNPREGWPSEKAVATAAKANHIIERVAVFDTIEEAVADLNLILSTTARSRDMFKPVIGPDEAVRQAQPQIADGRKVGILFGRERWGLNNAEVALSDFIVTLPVEPAFASLNIAQAVLVLAYEWRRLATADALPFEGDLGTPAKREEVIGLVGHIEEALDRAEFFSVPDKKPTFLNNLTSMFSRARFNDQEVRTLRGVIAALDRRHLRPNPSRPQKKKERPE